MGEWSSQSDATHLYVQTAKKTSDPNLASPLTPAPPSGGISLSDEGSGSLGHEGIVEEYATPKSNTPVVPPGGLPLSNQSTTDDHTDTLIQLTNNLNQAIRQRDINSFQWDCVSLLPGSFMCTIRELCDPKITCFDSKVGPVLIEGMDYHTFRFSTG